jgi:hypothetical protein
VVDSIFIDQSLSPDPKDLKLSAATSRSVIVDQPRAVPGP